MVWKQKQQSWQSLTPCCRLTLVLGDLQRTRVTFKSLQKTSTRRNMSIYCMQNTSGSTHSRQRQAYSAQLCCLYCRQPTFPTLFSAVQPSATHPCIACLHMLRGTKLFHLCEAGFSHICILKHCYGRGCNKHNVKKNRACSQKVAVLNLREMAFVQQINSLTSCTTLCLEPNPSFQTGII